MFASKDRFLTNAVASSGYSVTKSLRFRASATAYLNRTFGTPTDANKWTLSLWTKIGDLARDGGWFSAGAFNNGSYIEYNSAQKLQILGTSNTVTTRVFRDPSAWYHFVIAVDEGAAGTDKLKLYINGVQETSFSTDGRATFNGAFNTAVIHYIGLIFNTTYTFDGYMAEMYFVDGQQLAPTSFGSFDANGVWSPTAYSGTYGNNGFYLKFADNSGATATTIGKDSSGNGNNWTPNNISVTAGTTYDSMIDSPTNAASATQPVGNYCVLNPIDKGTSGTISAANLQWAYSAAAWNGIRSTFAIPLTGQWYWEATVLGTYCDIGIATSVANLNSSGYNDALCYSYGSANAAYRYGGVDQGTVATYTTNDVIAYYINAGVVKVYKNNSLIATWSQNLSAYSGQYFPAIYCNTNSAGVAVNFGQRPFVYTPPGSALALCTANLATPTIKNGAQYMAATTYTGTGATLSITNTVNSTSFKPDWVWIKGRSGATSHKLTDSVRGVTKALSTDSTANQVTDAGGVTAFNSNGFTVGTTAAYNTNTATYIGWQWLCNAGTTSSNTNGSITSTVQVNATAGFSIVSYVGTSANATVGHGLGVAPSMFILKSYIGTVSAWPMYHISIGASKFLLVNVNNAAGSSTSYFNGTAPTSTVFSLGIQSNTNASGETYVAYCFAPITGYNSFGSYTGNGSTEGPFVYCGFRPRWLMIKRSSTASVTFGWQLYDTTRSPYNTTALPGLWADTSSAEAANTYSIDILSNGFKLRDSNVNMNASGDTYIYAAFAENPFNYSRAR